jgi:hypothetical protein
MEASRVIRSRRAPVLGLLACAAVLIPAASAAADFAPNLAISFSPGTPGQPTAITSVLTQAPGQTPSRTVKVSFPPGFIVNAGTKAKVCTPSQDQDDLLRCPADTQIGTVQAATDVFGTYQPAYSGFVYFGGPVPGKVGSLQLLLLLRPQEPGYPEQRILGIASLRPDGGYDNTFDNLPNVLVRSFTLALSGGDLALLKNPTKCGQYAMGAQYTSQNDETSSQSIPFTVPCATKAAKPRVAALSLSRSGVASFTLSRAGKVKVTLSHGGKAVKSRTISGKKGTNRVTLVKLASGHKYTVSVVGANIVRRTVG